MSFKNDNPLSKYRNFKHSELQKLAQILAMDISGVELES